MCSIAIDFGKHGEKYVPDYVVEEYWKMLEFNYPDFMEKNDKPQRESIGILGLLYRDIKREE